MGIAPIQLLINWKETKIQLDRDEHSHPHWGVCFIHVNPPDVLLMSLRADLCT